MALSGHGKLVTLVPAAVVLMLLCAGAVQATCSSGQKFCSGSCVHPKTDANNCGDCGVKCIAANAVSTCYMGKCEHECKPGFKNCDDKWENGCECEPHKDVKNCGRCGVKCEAPANAWAKCHKGSCEYECKPGHKNCDGKWENGCECYPETDPKNCGECGNKCHGGEGRCTKGKCEEACKKGHKYNNSKKRCEKDGDDDEGKGDDDDHKKGKGGDDDDDKKGKGGDDDDDHKKGKGGDDDDDHKKGKGGDDDDDDHKKGKDGDDDDD